MMRRFLIVGLFLEMFSTSCLFGAAYSESKAHFFMVFPEDSADELYPSESLLANQKVYSVDNHRLIPLPIDGTSAHEVLDHFKSSFNQAYLKAEARFDGSEQAIDIFLTDEAKQDIRNKDGNLVVFFYHSSVTGTPSLEDPFLNTPSFSSIPGLLTIKPTLNFQSSTKPVLKIEKANKDPLVFYAFNIYRFEDDFPKIKELTIFKRKKEQGRLSKALAKLTRIFKN